MKPARFIGPVPLKDLVRMPAGTVGIYRLAGVRSAQAQGEAQGYAIRTGGQASTRCYHGLPFSDAEGMPAEVFMEVTVITPGQPAGRRGRKPRA